MKMRLSVNEHGELVARDGTVVGRLQSVTIDIDGIVVGGRGEDGPSDNSESNSPPTPTGEQTALLDSPLQQVWSHYQTVVPHAERRKLDSRRRGIITRALGVRTVEQCCEAITRLASSRWHNGDNPSGKKYLDIEYALGQRSESPDARIDRWLEQTTDETPASHVDSLLARFSDEARRHVQSWMNDVEAWARNQDNPGLKLTAQSAMAKLRRQGINGKLDGSTATIRWERIDAEA